MLCDYLPDQQAWSWNKLFTPRVSCLEMDCAHCVHCAQCACGGHAGRDMRACMRENRRMTQMVKDTELRAEDAERRANNAEQRAKNAEIRAENAEQRAQKAELLARKAEDCLQGLWQPRTPFYVPVYAPPRSCTWHVPLYAPYEFNTAS